MPSLSCNDHIIVQRGFGGSAYNKHFLNIDNLKSVPMKSHSIVLRSSEQVKYVKISMVISSC